MRLVVIAVPVALLALAGCGDIPSAVPEDSAHCGDYGTFTATVTGTVRTQLLGCSVYAVVPAAGGATAFVLLLFQGNPPTPADLLEIAAQAARPEPGIYSVGGESGVFLATYSHRETGISRLFEVTGSLSVTTSSSAGVIGSVVLTGTSAGQGVRIIGSYRARCAALAEGHAC